MSETPSGNDQVETPPNNAKIKELNDRFRQSFLGGDVLLTTGFQALSTNTQSNAIEAIQKFDNFTKDNDPYGEHDFGEVVVDKQKVWFKIDYYGLDVQSGSPDPSDPAVTKRVLTIFLPEEY